MNCVQTLFPATINLIHDGAQTHRVKGKPQVCTVVAFSEGAASQVRGQDAPCAAA